MPDLTMHFASTGPKFPWSYYVGIMSAAKCGPVKLWYTEEPSGEWFPQVKKAVPTFKVSVPDLLALRGRDPHFNYVSWFDWLIWKAVAQEGGSVMGLDSLTLKPFHDLLNGKEMLVGIDAENMPTSYCMHGATAKPGSELAAEIHERSTRALMGEEIAGELRAFDDRGLRFGGAGIIPFLNVVYENEEKVEKAPFGVLGGYLHDGSPFYLYEPAGELLHPDCRTIPFYATWRAEQFRAIAPETVQGTLLGKLIEANGLGVEGKAIPSLAPRQSEPAFRFHLLSLVHLPQSAEFLSCAYTQKNRKLARMLASLGHEVIFYGCEGSDVADYSGCEFVPTHSLADIARDYGDGDNRFSIGYNWRETDFRHDWSGERKPSTKKFYQSCIDHIAKVKRPDDFLLLTQGCYHGPIRDAVGLYLNCEPGIGYRGSDKRNFRAFESSYLQNFAYGSEAPFQSINGRYYDRVIPNYFDPEDVTYSDQKGDYFFYCGRMITRKGIRTADLVCRHLGARLILAGQGGTVDGQGRLVCQDFHLEPGTWEYIGFADVETRKELMAHAIAFFCPTEYMEPFAGTHVEAMLSGTPPITTNFGVFPGTIPDYLNGIIGYRCNTLQDFVDAALDAPSRDPHTIRRYAERFLMDNVKWEFEQWFQDLYKVWESTLGTGLKGWNRLRPLEEALAWDLGEAEIREVANA